MYCVLLLTRKSGHKVQSHVEIIRQLHCVKLQSFCFVDRTEDHVCKTNQRITAGRLIDRPMIYPILSVQILYLQCWDLLQSWPGSCVWRQEDYGDRSSQSLSFLATPCHLSSKQTAQTQQNCLTSSLAYSQRRVSLKKLYLFKISSQK